MVAHQLREEGTGTAMRHTEVLSYEEEELHQEREILGMHLFSQVSLHRSLFFMNGKVLCLRGGCKHKDLKLSFPLERKETEVVVYTESGPKKLFR